MTTVLEDPRWLALSEERRDKLLEEYRNVNVEYDWWDSLIDGVEKPILNKGYIKVPEGPGLGFTINEEAFKEHLIDKNFFDPTPEWDNERSQDNVYT